MPILYVRTKVSISSKRFMQPLWKPSFQTKCQQVSGIASKRGVACHPRPVRPDLGGQTPSTAGHWVLGHVVAGVCGDTIRDMSYNRCMTEKHGQCVKINL